LGQVSICLGFCNLLTSSRGLLGHPEDGGIKFLRNIGILLHHHSIDLNLHRRDKSHNVTTRFFGPCCESFWHTTPECFFVYMGEEKL